MPAICRPVVPRRKMTVGNAADPACSCPHPAMSRLTRVEIRVMQARTSGGSARRKKGSQWL
jgi:hypothetical protein